MISDAARRSGRSSRAYIFRSSGRICGRSAAGSLAGSPIAFIMHLASRSATSVACFICPASRFGRGSNSLAIACAHFVMASLTCWAHPDVVHVHIWSVNCDICRIAASPDEVGPVTCSESAAQTIALCAAIPSAARIANVRVQARVPKSESPWLERDAGAPTVGNLHVAAATSESPVSADQRSVCLEVSNWSVDDTLAVRVIVDYAFGSAPTSELTAAAPTAHTL